MFGFNVQFLVCCVRLCTDEISCNSQTIFPTQIMLTMLQNTGLGVSNHLTSIVVF